MKTKFIFFLLAIFAVASFGLIDNKTLVADEVSDTICYVSFGDSIAVGYNLPNYISGTSDASDEAMGQFVEDSYTYNFKTMLENKFGTNNVVSTTYAQSGDSSKELINKLNSTTVQNTLKSADIVTICIGANDILGPALNNISGYVLKDSVSGSVTVAEMENQLSDGLENFKGKDGAEGNLDKILNKLYAINPDAIYIFTNVYNPYKVFALPTSLSSFISYTDFSEQKINQMGEITEVYLAGGTNTQGQTIQGLNQILESKIEAFGCDNFALVDSHASFDLHTLSTTPKYNELVYASLTQNSSINMNELMSGGADFIMEKSDPHPTELGHGLLYDEFKNFFDNQICTVTLDYNGEIINGKSSEIKFCNKYASSKLPTLNSNNKVFAGWYTSGGDKWEENSQVVSDMVLYAKWTQAEWVVDFDCNGGSECMPIGVANGTKITNPPQPVRLNCDENIFAGWYYNHQLWDFDNNVVTSNITLVAKWVGLVCDTNLNLQQTIDQTKAVSFSVELPNSQLAWYVNNVLQNNQTSNTFLYTPSEVGEYLIYCVANGVKSKQYTISVDFLVPTDLVLNSQKNDNGEYLFSIKNGEYYNPDKIVWYKTSNVNSSDFEIIGTGVFCNEKITSNCYVYAVYDNLMMSEKLQVKIAETNEQSDNGILIVIIITASIVLITSAVIIILKIKSTKKA